MPLLQMDKLQEGVSRLSVLPAAGEEPVRVQPRRHAELVKTGDLVRGHFPGHRFEVILKLFRIPRADDD